MFGTKVQNFAGSMVFIIAPFRLVLSINRPLTGRKIAFIVPSSYVFEAARQVFVENMLDWNKVIIAFL